MAVNLLDLVKNAVSGSIGDQLGSLVGIDKSKSASAIESVVPVLLGSLMKKASTPSGASELSKVFKEQDTSILDNLGGLLGGSGASDMLSMGTKFLPMLLGSSQSSIISTLVKLLGYNTSTVTSLLGYLAPIVMSVVGKQAKAAGGFDPGAITDLLKGQSNFLGKALPNELKGAMGVADLFGGKVNEPVRATTTAPTKAAESSSNPLAWLLPLIALAALGYLGYTFFNQKPAEKPVDKKPSTVTSGTRMNEKPDAKMELPSIDTSMLDDLKKKLSGTFDGLTGTLEGITDIDTAKGALSKIEEAAKAYEGLGIDKLPAAAKTGLIPFLKPYVSKIGELIEKLYIIPGVKDIVEPAIGPMLKTVTGLVG
ncbi:MAG: DUF937 domain-containing protein [Planctomycetota bacterium]|jgi:hypothetical protein